MLIIKNRKDERFEIQSLSHQLLEVKQLGLREKIVYSLVVLFAVVTVGSAIGILVSIFILGLMAYGLFRFIEKRWLQAAVSVDDVSSLVELGDAALYVQGAAINECLAIYRDQLLNPDLSNAELQEIVVVIQDKPGCVAIR